MRRNLRHLLGSLALAAGICSAATWVPVPLEDDSKQAAKEIRRFLGHTDGVWSVAFTPDGRQAISGSYDRTIRLWDLATGKELRRLEGHAGPVLSVAVAPDGRTALWGSADGTIRLWDLINGRQVQVYAGHKGAVNSVVFMKDGKSFASAGADQVVRIWDGPSGKVTKTLTGHTDWIWCLAVSPDGKQIISGSRGPVHPHLGSEHGQGNTLAGGAFTSRNLPGHFTGRQTHPIRQC